MKISENFKNKKLQKIAKLIFKNIFIFTFLYSYQLNEFKPRKINVDDGPLICNYPTCVFLAPQYRSLF
jgi:hypothetical protein